VRVDAHQHFWRFDAERDAWITPGMPVLRRDFLPSDLQPLIRRAVIDAVVAVQADQSEDETDFLLSLAAQHPWIRGVVGWVDLRAHDLDDRVGRWSSARTLKGFRHVAQAEPADFLTRPDVIAGVRRLGELGYTYDILIYPRQLDAALTLVQHCPDVQFVLDHCAKPMIATGDLVGWREGIAQIAEHENVTCKVSGLVTEASWTRWTHDDLLPVLDHVADVFSPSRLMFGSDWPVCLLAAEYTRVAEVIERWTERLSVAERERVFGGTAIAAYRLDLMP
jgi:L-fuconolactonase